MAPTESETPPKTTAAPRHYDEVEGTLTLPHLNRLLAGSWITVTRHLPGVDGHVDDPCTFEIEAVTGICVGVGDTGIFGGVTVRGGGNEWTLFDNGHGEDGDGRSCSHTLRRATGRPVTEPVTPA